MRGTLADAVEGADVFIGVSVGGALKPEMIRTMAQGSHRICHGQPRAGDHVRGGQGGRRARDGHGPVSDYPNQINNVLAFPGGVQGRAVRCSARDINYAP